MRLLLSGLIGAMIGLVQLLAVTAIELRSVGEAIDQQPTSGPSGFWSEISFPLLGFLIFLEVIGVMALSIYRFSPWVLRLLRAGWEAQKVVEAKRENSAFLTRGVLIVTILRRSMIMIDLQHLSFELLLSLFVALLVLFVPPSKPR